MIVQAFWRGPIGTMERMSMHSHVDVGHTIHLYSYELNTALNSQEPKDLLIFDANEIVPKERLVWFPSSSIFSDYFRYCLLRDRGGWWVDLDTIALKPFTDLDQSDYVIASDNIDQFFVSGNFFKTPVGAPIVTEGAGRLERMTDSERSALGHMDPGPYWLQRAVKEFGLTGYVQPPEVFDPIPYTRLPWIVDPRKTEELEQACAKAHAIHLRRSIWDLGPNSCAGILPDGSKIMIDKPSSETCLWTKLKKEYL